MKLSEVHVGQRVKPKLPLATYFIPEEGGQVKENDMDMFQCNTGTITYAYLNRVPAYVLFDMDNIRQKGFSAYLKDLQFLREDK